MTRSGRGACLCILAPVAALLCWPQAVAWADDAPPSPGIPSPSIATSLPEIADPGGIRAALAARGVTLQLNFIGEVLGNPSGGVRRGVIYEGFVEPVIDVDLAKAIGAEGLTLHANAYQIHGRGLSRDDVGNLFTVSSIEALPSTRLQQAWAQQKLGGDKGSVRAGLLAADAEFITSTNAGLFINSTFGWPEIAAADLPSGGPAYPLAAPGVRLELDPTAADSILLAVFDGDPAGPGRGDPQRRDSTGLNGRVTDPPFAIGELQHKTTVGSGDTALSGSLKAGAWGHFGSFADLHFGSDGRSLADPSSNGLPVQHRGDVGIYGVLDQQVYRLPGDDATKGVGLFARVFVSPQQDRNLITASVDAGVNVNGLIAGRRDDSFGFAFSYARISNGARALDLDAARLAATPLPVRDGEAVFEATYQAQIVPGWSVQPDVQYVVRPGGGVADPGAAPGTRIRNAAVLGLRTTINY